MARLLSSVVLVLSAARNSVALPFYSSGQSSLQQKYETSTADVANFQYYLQYNSAAYCDDIYVAGNAITCHGGCNDLQTSGATIVGSFKDTAFLNEPGYVAINPARQEIVVVYRGTHSVGNYISDALFALSSCDLFGDCEIFYGFKQAFDSTKDLVFSYVSAAQRAYPNYKIIVTGYSLGGGVATVTAAYLREQGGFECDLYTYGSPRVGSPAFIEFISNQPGREYRITHTDDPIPRLPPSWLDYVHTSPEYWIYKDADPGTPYETSDFIICEGYNNSACNGGTSGLDINAHLHYFQPAGCTSSEASLDTRDLSARGDGSEGWSYGSDSTGSSSSSDTSSSSDGSGISVDVGATADLDSALSDALDTVSSSADSVVAEVDNVEDPSDTSAGSYDESSTGDVATSDGWSDASSSDGSDTVSPVDYTTVVSDGSTSSVTGVDVATTADEVTQAVTDEVAAVTDDATGSSGDDTAGVSNGSDPGSGDDAEDYNYGPDSNSDATGIDSSAVTDEATALLSGADDIVEGTVIDAVDTATSAIDSVLGVGTGTSADSSASGIDSSSGGASADSSYSSSSSSSSGWKRESALVDRYVTNTPVVDEQVDLGIEIVVQVNAFDKREADDNDNNNNNDMSDRDDSRLYDFSSTTSSSKRTQPGIAASIELDVDDNDVYLDESIVARANAESLTVDAESGLDRAFDVVLGARDHDPLISDTTLDVSVDRRAQVEQAPGIDLQVDDDDEDLDDVCLFGIICLRNIKESSSDASGRSSADSADGGGSVDGSSDSVDVGVDVGSVDVSADV